MSRPVVWSGRIAILLVLVAAWQYLPANETLRDFSSTFDTFFLSSPGRVASELRDLAFGGGLDFWRNLWFTSQGLLLGCSIGLAGSVAVALILSNSELLSAALTPILDVINAVPTITMIPIIVLMFGPTLTTSVVTAAQSVFFFAFFNSYAGGVSIRQDLLHNASLLGASSHELMWQMRARYVLAWTFGVLPGAVGRALTAAFSAELFSGSAGLGRLVMRALLTINSDLTFAIVIVLCMLGVVLTTGVEALTRRYLHWWQR